MVNMQNRMTPTDGRGQTTVPLSSAAVLVALQRPEFCRLPQPGSKCPHTGLSRSALNALILPSEENGYNPPVKSFVLRKTGAKTGIRLIDFQSLVEHIRSQPAPSPKGGMR